MQRKRSALVIQRNGWLRKQIENIKADHPFWGYRRVWSYLTYRQGYHVNKKRIYRLMKEHNLLVTKTTKNRAKRTPLCSKPRAQYANHIWGTDMTKLKLASYGWMYLHVVLDWYTKEIIGYSLSLQSKTDDWIDALNMAVNKRFPEGIKDTPHMPLNLVSDNGCQPTSERYMKECSVLEIKQIFTSWSNPKGNADTERVIRTIKEDLVWPNEWDNPFEFTEAFKKWVCDYNSDFPHQSLGNKTPAEFYKSASIKQEQVLTYF